MRHPNLVAICLSIQQILRSIDGVKRHCDSQKGSFANILNLRGCQLTNSAN